MRAEQQRVPTWIVVGVVLAAAAAFLMRTATSYRLVFTPQGIAFEENDGWYHVRSAQNLAAHFPRRSSFDPYAIYPGGQPLVTGPFWDYMIATPAWIIGLGKPSPRTVELVAAWLTPLLGTLFPPIVFWLVRFLFNDLAGLFAAWWIALIPGVLLWTSRLGGADHHTAESLLALVALGLVAKASEAKGRHAVFFVIVAGIALGAFFANRPAAIFVVGILVVSALIEPVLAPVSMIVLGIAALLFIPASGALWSGETWTALGGGIAATFAFGAITSWGRSRLWTPAALLGLRVAAVAGTAVCAEIARPSLFPYLLFQVQRSLGQAGNTSVGELLPMLQTQEASAWTILTNQLGTSWVFALLAFPALIYMSGTTKRPAMILFAVWTAVMAAGAFAQVRMAVYLCVNSAMLAGVACAWIASFRAREMQRVPVVLLLIALAANVPTAVKSLAATTRPTPEWQQALAWMRTHSPEPLGDAAAWTSFYAPPFQYPPQAYGVAVWWDFGYWVEYLSHRIPTSNGTQAGAEDTARFFTETDPTAALRQFDAMGARYTIVDPLTGGANQAWLFMTMLPWARRHPQDYVRLVSQGGGPPLSVYLPSFYRAMSVRLFLSDGQPTPAKAKVWVLHTHWVQGQPYPQVDSNRQFSTEKEALEFAANRPEFIIGGNDPGSSCVPLDGVSGLRLAYTSDGAGAVKVFERTR